MNLTAEYLIIIRRLGSTIRQKYDVPLSIPLINNVKEKKKMNYYADFYWVKRRVLFYYSLGQRLYVREIHGTRSISGFNRCGPSRSPPFLPVKFFITEGDCAASRETVVRLGRVKRINDRAGGGGPRLPYLHLLRLLRFIVTPQLRHASQTQQFTIN